MQVCVQNVAATSSTRPIVFIDLNEHACFVRPVVEFAEQAFPEFSRTRVGSICGWYNAKFHAILIRVAVYGRIRSSKPGSAAVHVANLWLGALNMRCAGPPILRRMHNSMSGVADEPHVVWRSVEFDSIDAASEETLYGIVQNQIRTDIEKAIGGCC